MVRFVLTTVMMLVMAAPAWADTGRVCARSAVVELVSTLLSAAGRPARLDAGSVGEVSTVPGRLIRCAVRGQTEAYDTNQHGMQPSDATFVVQYTLELRQNGIFLHLD